MTRKIIKSVNLFTIFEAYYRFFKCRQMKIYRLNRLVELMCHHKLIWWIISLTAGDASNQHFCLDIDQLYSSLLIQNSKRCNLNKFVDSVFHDLLISPFNSLFDFGLDCVFQNQKALKWEMTISLHKVNQEFTCCIKTLLISRIADFFRTLLQRGKVCVCEGSRENDEA